MYMYIHAVYTYAGHKAALVSPSANLMMRARPDAGLFQNPSNAAQESSPAPAARDVLCVMRCTKERTAGRDRWRCAVSMVIGRGIG